ncbi:MAG TPA: AAA family ATPase [Steroidobacteraceae bacterium]|nr:AAA family ATPase [Steroidobacteraceae bacterium]
MPTIELAPNTDGPPDDGVPLFDYSDEPALHGRANGHLHLAPDTDQDPPAPPVFDPERARLRATILDEAPAPVESIVEGLLRRTAGVRVASGGSGKSTLTLFEMVCVVLGCPLFGREVMRPGPCVLLTAEDERQVVEYRLARILEDMRLPRVDRERVLTNIYVEDLTGRTCRLIDVNLGGSLLPTAAVGELIERYRSIQPAFLSIDPMTLFGPGERHVNDGEAELLRAGRAISYGLRAAVRFEHHSGKQNARDRQTDQYAGRGGSAGADNARFVHVLTVHSPDDKLAAPSRVTPEDIAKGNLLRLHVAKDSYGARLTAPIWIQRSGFLFTHVAPDPQADLDPMQAPLRRLYEFIESEEAAGIRHTANTLDNRLGELQLARQSMRAALHVALERQHLLEQPLPVEEQRGRRKTYLAKGLRP